jgi:hypothetical protein
MVTACEEPGRGEWVVCYACRRRIRRFHAHHITYDPPRVVPLCPRCHGRIHAQSSRRDLFRPSYYRLCLKLIRQRFQGGLPKNPEEIAQAILNDPEMLWRREGMGRPTWREALMAANISLQVEGLGK